MRWQIAAEWFIEIAKWSQLRACIGNHHRFFEWHCSVQSFIFIYGSGTVTDDLTVHKHGGPKCTSQDQLRDACCHLANMIEDIDKISFAYEYSTARPFRIFALRILYNSLRKLCRPIDRHQPFVSNQLIIVHLLLISLLTIHFANFEL